jgi:hypothetical protein
VGIAQVQAPVLPKKEERKEGREGERKERREGGREGGRKERKTNKC